MNREEFQQLAAPNCDDCGVPYDRVEIQYKFENDSWVIDWAKYVCPYGHRRAIKLS